MSPPKKKKNLISLFNCVNTGYMDQFFNIKSGRHTSKM